MAKNVTSDYPAKKRRLVQDLAAGSFFSGYLVCGEEDYLRTQDVRFLLERLGGRPDDMNFTRFSGKDVRAEEVIGTAMTMPFFADRRVILVEDSGWFAAKKRKEKTEEPEEKEESHAGGEDAKRMADYLKAPSSTTHIVFSERDVNRTTTLYKTMDKAGFVLTCDPPSEADLRKWVAKRLSDDGLRIEQQAADRLFVLTAGGISGKPQIDMNLLAMQIEKLVCYCMGRDAVRLADVDAICSDSLTDSVYAMVDCMSKGDRQGAMALYQDMLSMKIAPFRILSLISSQFNSILQVSELMQRRRSQMEIAEALAANPYRVRLCMGWSRNFSQERLTEILSACAESETAVKRGKMSDRIAVESLIAGGV